MFLRNYVKKGLLEAIGKMPDYQIILNSMGWYEKGVLLEEDLEEINKAIEEHNKEKEEIIEQPIEEENEKVVEEQDIEEPTEELVEYVETMEVE